MASRAGCPNKSLTLKQAKLNEVIDSIVDWKAFYAKVYEAAMAGDMKAAKIIEERRWGKPNQPIEHSGELNFDAKGELKRRLLQIAGEVQA